MMYCFSSTENNYNGRILDLWNKRNKNIHVSTETIALLKKFIEVCEFFFCMFKYFGKGSLYIKFSTGNYTLCSSTSNVSGN